MSVFELAVAAAIGLIRFESDAALAAVLGVPAHVARWRTADWR